MRPHAEEEEEEEEEGHPGKGTDNRRIQAYLKALLVRYDINVDDGIFYPSWNGSATVMRLVIAHPLIGYLCVKRRAVPQPVGLEDVPGPDGMNRWVGILASLVTPRPRLAAVIQAVVIPPAEPDDTSRRQADSGS